MHAYAQSDSLQAMQYCMKRTYKFACACKQVSVYMCACAWLQHHWCTVKVRSRWAFCPFLVNHNIMVHALMRPHTRIPAVILKDKHACMCVWHCITVTWISSSKVNLHSEKQEWRVATFTQQGHCGLWGAKPEMATLMALVIHIVLHASQLSWKLNYLFMLMCYCILFYSIDCVCCCAFLFMFENNGTY